MTGEAQCEDRKRTLAWHHIHTHFTLHKQCAEVISHGLISALKTSHNLLIVSIWDLNKAFDLQQHTEFFFISWYYSKKKRENLWKSCFASDQQTQYSVLEANKFVYLCLSIVGVWATCSQEKPKWSIITSSKLPLFPFQHHTELRYQLTHYPLSPGDW